MPCASLQRKRVEFQKSSSEIQQLLLKLGFICDNDDPVGNITQIDDNAQQTIYFNGSVVSPSQKFEYNALYRLLKSTGREHVSINASSEPEAEGYNPAQISPQDGSAMRNYVREWQYDSVGNILSLIHNANGNAWTRSYDYASDSNRLNSTTVGQTTVNYTYNAHGSMTSMPHLSAMGWDFAERLSHVTRGTTDAYYNYDGQGQRIRKVVVKGNVTETRLYLGGFEVYRKSIGGLTDTERETLHVMDDKKRIALVETLTVENGSPVANLVPVQRYQLDNHLGSASLELDDSANIVSYEEYYPYGETSYRAGRTAGEVSQKRYRYTGKEKDEESGLYYHGARYYACWLGRWTAADPAGMVDGVNLYMYVRGNPVSGVDPSGTQTVKNDDQLINAPKVKEKAQRTVGSDNLAKALLNAENEELSVASVDSFANEAKEMVTFVAKAIKKYKIDRFIEKMVYHHLSMVRENENDKENHKEISAIGTNLRNLNTIYIGFYDKERKTHTMGSEFGDSLSVSTKAFKNSNPNEKLLVFHLHPWQNAGKTSFILGLKERNSMFSFPGDHDNMKDGQIWVGIEVLTRKDGSYFYDVHVSGKALGIQSIPIYRGEIDVNKCAPQLFKKEIQMTK